MKAFFMKLLKDKATKKASESLNENGVSLSPLFKYAIFGGSGFVFFLLGIIVICVVIFTPVFLSEEYFGSDTKVQAYDFCGESCGENESKFYSKLNEVRESYKSRGITIDTNLISGTVFYGSILSSESFDPNDPDSDTLIDDSKIHISDVKSLASNMVNGNSIDYNKYRSYLVSTYIPKRFSNMYHDDKGIQKIADDIMSYASFKGDAIASSGSLGVSCTSITLKEDDGTIKPHVLEEYVAGVVEAENGGAGPEARKVQALAARTNAVTHCNSVIDNSTNFQKYKTPSFSAIESAEATKGLVLTYDGEMLKEMPFASYPMSNYRGGFPGYEALGHVCSDVKCTTGSDGRQWCDTTLYRVPNMESFQLSMPDTNLNGSLWNGLHLDNQKGHCYGVSQVASIYYENELNYDYKKMIEVFFSDGVEITSVNNVKLGLINGGKYSTNAPMYNTSNEFFSNVDYRYYASTSSMPDPQNYGECPWYAKGRAIELIAYSNMPDDLKNTLINSLRNTRGNGGQWYTNPSNELFTKSNDLYAARPGSIVSWTKVGGYGHVGIVEDVEYDENGRAKSILLSEGWNGTGNPSAAHYAFRRLNIEQFRTYNGGYIFNGYVYLLG